MDANAMMITVRIICHLFLPSYNNMSAFVTFGVQLRGDLSYHYVFILYVFFTQTIGVLSLMAKSLSFAQS